MKATEIKLNQLKPFTGKREELKKFLQDTNLYLLVNNKVYDTDIKKIMFALSFMNEGDAASWKEQLFEDMMALPTFDLGTWATFCNGRGYCNDFPSTSRIRWSGWGLRR